MVLQSDFSTLQTPGISANQRWYDVLITAFLPKPQVLFTEGPHKQLSVAELLYCTVYLPCFFSAEAVPTKSVLMQRFCRPAIANHFPMIAIKMQDA